MEEGNITHPKEISEADLFKKKFPGQGAPKNSLFLKKRLQGGHKYFDSGDYYSAKSSERKDPNIAIGKTIPTVDKLPQRQRSSSHLVDAEPSSPPAHATEEKSIAEEEKATREIEVAKE